VSIESDVALEMILVSMHLQKRRKGWGGGFTVGPLEESLDRK